MQSTSRNRGDRLRRMMVWTLQRSVPAFYTRLAQATMNHEAQLIFPLNDEDCIGKSLTATAAATPTSFVRCAIDLLARLLCAPEPLLSFLPLICLSVLLCRKKNLQHASCRTSSPVCSRHYCHWSVTLIRNVQRSQNVVSFPRSVSHNM